MKQVKAFFNKGRDWFNGLDDEKKGWVVVSCGVVVGCLIGLMVV